MNNNSRKRVGYWWSEKKSQKMNLAELARQFTEKGCEFVRLDLNSDLEAQGPFDAIIHKLSDVMCKADRDPLAAQQVKSFEVSFVCLSSQHSPSSFPSLYFSSQWTLQTSSHKCCVHVHCTDIAMAFHLTVPFHVSWSAFEYGRTSVRRPLQHLAMSALFLARSCPLILLIDYFLWLSYLLQDYAKAHPEVVIIDSLDNVRKVLDRSRQYKIIDDSELAIEGKVHTFLIVISFLTDIFKILLYSRWCLYSHICRDDVHWCAREPE